MGDDSGDKRGRGRPKKSDTSVEEPPEKINRGRPRKAAEAASAAVRDQSNRDDEGEPRAKRGRGRPKGSTGRRKKKSKSAAAKKRAKNTKVTSGGDAGGEDGGD